MGDFLEQIPVVKDIVKLFPSMDFEGQKLAERLYQWVVILFAVVGFIWGYLCQQFAQTIYILGAGVCLACILVLPPWGLYRRHPLKWQKDQSLKDKGYCEFPMDLNGHTIYCKPEVMKKLLAKLNGEACKTKKEPHHRKQKKKQH